MANESRAFLTRPPAAADRNALNVTTLAPRDGWTTQGHLNVVNESEVVLCPLSPCCLQLHHLASHAVAVERKQAELDEAWSFMRHEA